DLSYYVLVVGNRPLPQAYRSGISCRNWGLDLMWVKENLSLPRQERTRLRDLAQEAWRFVTLREWNDTLVLDDPIPGLIDLSRIAARLGHMLNLVGRLSPSVL